MQFLRDRVVVTCVTVIIIALMTGIVILITTNHSQDAFRIITLVTTLSAQLASFIGITVRVNSLSGRVETLESVTTSSHSIAQDNNDKLGTITNGNLKGEVKTAVNEVLDERKDN